MIHTCTKRDVSSAVACLPDASPALQSVLTYRNDAVVARYRKEFGLSDQEAELLFADVKTYLWLASVEGIIAPPPKVDDGWHIFLIFTLDYQRFCDQFFGGFLHHRPSRPEDRPDEGMAVRGTIAAVLRHFKSDENLSHNWNFPGSTKGPGLVQACSSDSVSCAPTPSCDSSFDEVLDRRLAVSA